MMREELPDDLNLWPNSVINLYNCAIESLKHPVYNSQYDICNIMNAVLIKNDLDVKITIMRLNETYSNIWALEYSTVEDKIEFILKWD